MFIKCGCFLLLQVSPRPEHRVGKTKRPTFSGDGRRLCHPLFLLAMNPEGINTSPKVDGNNGMMLIIYLGRAEGKYYLGGVFLVSGNYLKVARFRL